MVGYIRRQKLTKRRHRARALGESGIKLIHANSPLAKGRIERRKYPLEKNVTFPCSNEG